MSVPQFTLPNYIAGAPAAAATAAARYAGTAALVEDACADAEAWKLASWYVLEQIASAAGKRARAVLPEHVLDSAPQSCRSGIPPLPVPSGTRGDVDVRLAQAEATLLTLPIEPMDCGMLPAAAAIARILQAVGAAEDKRPVRL